MESHHTRYLNTDKTFIVIFSKNTYILLWNALYFKIENWSKKKINKIFVK